MAEPYQPELLLGIARCPKVAYCLESAGESHPCAEIVAAQHRGIAGFQVPEPWSGRLREAPVLFLGSNPSISEVEECPRWSWSDQDIVDFFEHRFGGGARQWVQGHLHPLRQDGTYGTKWVRYWAAVKKWAAELLQCSDPRPGLDHAMSEVVHCKSRREKGVRAAMEQCVSLYLARLVEESSALVIVSLGAVASSAVKRVWDIPPHVNVHGPTAVGQHERYFVFLPHPNAREVRSLGKCLSEGEIRLLRQFLEEPLSLGFRGSYPSLVGTDSESWRQAPWHGNPDPTPMRLA